MINPITIAVVAGEHSGDTYGAAIISDLKNLYPQAKFIGIGSDKMIRAGLVSLFPMEELSLIGFFNILKNIPRLIKIKNQLIHTLLQEKIDLYIGIDAPDFNLVVERKIKDISRKNDLGIKTIHYISPTIWAWRPRRIYKVAKAADLVLCIFPFEEKIYTDKNISAKFVGHPLTEVLSNRNDLDKQESLNKLNKLSFILKQNANAIESENSNIFTGENIIISLFPGSRQSELNSLVKHFLECAKLLYAQNSSYRFCVPILSQALYEQWSVLSKEYFLSINNIKDSVTLNFEKALYVVKLYEHPEINSHTIMRASDLVLCASGTTTLEAFLLGIPMVVAYKVSKLNELLFRALIKLNYIAMPNILADKLFNKKLVPEFLQEDVTAQNLKNAVVQELNNYQINNGLTDDWLAIQSYLKPDNIDHRSKVIGAITSILSK